ncbi:SDR family oxidoreductase [Brachybacterium vulturis]|uniref:SDR family oxidoreductase n=1 Tax=Brachybacterium vulturis TaxID=2017484 RepID=UPI003734DA43
MVITRSVHQSAPGPHVLAVAGATGTLGRSVVAAAESAGHEVRCITRSHGIDVTTGVGLAAALEGAHALIDCLKPPQLDDSAGPWFEAAASVLGGHAREAGVGRTVAVSIVGIDHMQDYPFYRAQLRHERAVREHCPDPVIVRATQFHDFVGGRLRRVGDHYEVMAVPSQSVDTRAVAGLLIAQALAVNPPALVEIAGPQEERTLDQARRLLAARGESAEVVGVPASESMTRGGMLPGPEVLRAGLTYDQWLAETYGS